MQRRKWFTIYIRILRQVYKKGRLCLILERVMTEYTSFTLCLFCNLDDNLGKYVMNCVRIRKRRSLSDEI